MILRRLITVLVLPMPVIAGPLDPPAGAPQPTMKTLSEVEPRIALNATNTPGDADSIYRITAPGSYYLTENLDGEAGKHGIEIAAEGVSLDLNGFVLEGGFNSLDGIHVQFQVPNLRIHNGSFEAWAGDAIDVNNSINVTISDVSVYGFSLTEVGIRVGDGARLTNCSVENTDEQCFLGGERCTLTNCIARQTQSLEGFSFGDRTILRNCSADACAGAGILAGRDSVVEGCTASNNSIGIYLVVGGLISRCTAESNTQTGIEVGGGTVVENCRTSHNATYGFYVVSDCVVRNNTSYWDGRDDPGGAGIRAVGTGSRIEGNTCQHGNYGIHVSYRLNIIVCNSARANLNGNYNLVSQNMIGPIVTTYAIPSSSTWANFSH